MAKQNYQKDAIINYETMGGWPIYKMNIAQILEEIGCKLNSETGMYEISKDDAVLDVYPVCFEDDGMGYGVNERYITEVSRFMSNDKIHVNFFREKAIPNATLWQETKFYPYASLKYKNTEVTTVDIRKNEDNKIEIKVQYDLPTICGVPRSGECWVKPEELKYEESD